MVYKGTVMEIYHDSIIVMAEDCTFKTIRKSNGFQEGMEIYFEERDIIKGSSLNIKNISKSIAAVFIFIVTSLYILGFWSENYKSLALLSVDINPSVEMEVNKNYRVIKVLALNEEASKLPLENLKNYPLIDALEEIVEMVESAGYIRKGESNKVLITSVELKNEDKDDKNLDNLIMEGKKKIEEASNEKGQKVEVVTIKSDKETLIKAKEENISVGKMEIYKEAQEDIINDDKKQSEEDFDELKSKKTTDFIKEVEKIKNKKEINKNDKLNKNQYVKENKKKNENKTINKDKKLNKKNKQIKKSNGKNKKKVKNQSNNKYKEKHNNNHNKFKKN